MENEHYLHRITNSFHCSHLCKPINSSVCRSVDYIGSHNCYPQEHHLADV